MYANDAHMQPLYHSQTFENRSSLPPNPPPGFDPEVAFAGGDTGAALFHPPKSSSAVTLGAAGAPNPLFPLPRPGVDDEAPPQPPKSFALGNGRAGGLADAVLEVTGEGSGFAHASFEPHASAVEKFDKAAGVLFTVDEDIGAVVGFGAGAERLKADVRLREEAGGFRAVGAGTGFEFSRILLELGPRAGLTEEDVVLGGEVKSPKPSPKLSSKPLDTLCGCGACSTDFGAAAGLGGGLGLGLKKPPLLEGGDTNGGDVTCGAATVER